MLQPLIAVFILIAAVEANKEIDILENRDVARCFREHENDALLGRDVCYVPNFCTSRSGASHFASNVALPVLKLIDPRVRNFLNIPSVTTVWNKLFEPNQHNTEQWVREVVPIFRTRFGIETISGIEMYEKSDTVCFDAMLYDSNYRNDDTNPFTSFEYPNVCRDFRRMVLTPMKRDCATEIFSDRNVLKTTLLLQRRSKTRNQGVASRQFRNIELVKENILDISENTYVVAFEDMSLSEQASIMRDADIFIAPHGNANVNIIFMRECSIVIELFPYKFRTNMYETLAKSRGVVYRSWESTIPRSSCHEQYNNMSTQQCWNDMQFCRVCARDVAFISPPPDTIARVLRDSIRERNECLKKYHTTYRQQQHESLQEMNERRCQCPNGEYVNANGTIFYCDGPRILRVLNWDTCIELGSRCSTTTFKISVECLMRLSFGE
eukprot:g4259.t1